MIQKIFLERGGLSLYSDSRDIAVPVEFKKEVAAWCKENDIIAELNQFNNDAEQQLMELLFDVNVWRIKNEEHRMLFALRWSTI